MTRRATHREQLTLRFDRDLAERLRGVAVRDAVSLNQAAVALLRKSVGLGAPRPTRGPSWVDKHAGTWTQAEAEELDRAVAELERVDEEIWRSGRQRGSRRSRG